MVNPLLSNRVRDAPSAAKHHMTAIGYSFFDTAIGRCGIAWGDYGVIGVQLPEAREIETLRRLFRLYPEARELRHRIAEAG